MDITRIPFFRSIVLKTIEHLKPDVVALATGSVPFVPEISGITSNRVVLAEDVLTGKAKTKDTAVAIIGGGIVGCETGGFLASKGKKVTIVETLPGVAPGLPEGVNANMVKRLEGFGTVILTNSKVKKVTAEGLILENGNEIKAGTVILAVGRRPDQALAASLQGTGVQVHVIGDCQNTGMIIDATREGAEVGLKI